jgi:succinate dehydrogenase hydrophobic anchor subunit
MFEISKPKSREGTFLWLYKIIAGGFIVIILAIHFIVNHFLGPKDGLLTYEAVLAYYKNPIVPIMEILFVILAVSHSLIGVRSILLDTNPTEKILKISDWIMIGIGGIAIIYGTWLVLILVMR